MRALGIVVLLGLVVIAGCDPGPTLPAPAAAIPVGVTEVDYDALDAALKERKGKVVLMDFWATWCPPCVERFPHFVTTHKKYADKGLVCMSVSMDRAWPRGNRGDDKAQVLAFLEENGATFPNFLATHRNDELFSKRFDLDGGIPHQVLFGKDGNRVWSVTEKRLSDANLNKLIEYELAK